MCHSAEEEGVEFNSREVRKTCGSGAGEETEEERPGEIMYVGLWPEAGGDPLKREGRRDALL